MAIQKHDQSDVAERPLDTRPPSQLLDWFSEGQALAVEFAGVVMTVRYVCRKGRRARIAIAAPAGAVFRALDSGETVASRDRPT